MLLFAGLSAEAQNLSQMPEEKRNKKLLQTAKETIKGGFTTSQNNIS